jgi:hypothetical protein
VIKSWFLSYVLFHVFPCKTFVWKKIMY